MRPGSPDRGRLGGFEGAGGRSEQAQRGAACWTASHDNPQVLACRHASRLREVFWIRADKEYPAEIYVEQRFEEVDHGDLKAESLKEAVSRDEVTEDPTSATTDTDGTVRIKRGRSEVKMPSNSEELRRRIRILAVTFVLARLKHSRRAYLADATLDIWNDHCDFVLGETVVNLKTSSADGKIVHRPDWKQVFTYEFEIRKMMTRPVLYDGMTLAAALKAARKDTEVKETFFNTPNAMAATTDRERSPRGGGGGGRGDWKNGKGKGKDDTWTNSWKKGKGKGKNQKGGEKLHHQTPDGRKICYAFNSVYERCKGACGMVHVCRKCFGNHPAHPCKKQPPAAAAHDAAAPAAAIEA